MVVAMVGLGCNREERLLLSANQMAGYLPGGCRGDTALPFPGEGQPPLAPGDYGVVVATMDGCCALLACVCDEVHLPGSLSLPTTPWPAEGCPLRSECEPALSCGEEGEGEEGEGEEGEGEILVGEGEGEIFVGEGEGEIFIGEGEGEVSAECMVSSDCPCGAGCLDGVCGLPCVFCNAVTNQCDECQLDSDCFGCNPSCFDGVCGVSCPDDAPICSVTSCVECVSSLDCGAHAPLCEDNTCTVCTNDEQCPGGTQCHEVRGTCETCMYSSACGNDASTCSVLAVFGEVCQVDDACGPTAYCNLPTADVSGCATPAPLLIGTTPIVLVSGAQLCFALEVGSYQFSTTATDCSFGSGEDPMLAVRTTSGEQLVFNDDANGGRCSYLEAMIPVPGYLLCVSGYLGQALATTTLTAVVN
jgi:hypothetical protein